MNDATEKRVRAAVTAVYEGLSAATIDDLFYHVNAEARFALNQALDDLGRDVERELAREYMTELLQLEDASGGYLSRHDTSPASPHFGRGLYAPRRRK